MFEDGLSEGIGFEILGGVGQLAPLTPLNHITLIILIHLWLLLLTASNQ